MDKATIKAVMADYGRRGRGAAKRRPRKHYQEAARKSWNRQGRANREAAKAARNGAD